MKQRLFNNGAKNHLMDSTDGELQDDLFVGAALGVENLRHGWVLKAEYNQVKGDVDGTGLSGAEYKQPNQR